MLLGEFDFVKAVATGEGMAAVIERVDDHRRLPASHRGAATRSVGRLERLLGIGRDDVIRTLAAIETPTAHDRHDALIDLARIVSRVLEQ